MNLIAGGLAWEHTYHYDAGKDKGVWPSLNHHLEKEFRAKKRRCKCVLVFRFHGGSETKDTHSGNFKTGSKGMRLFQENLNQFMNVDLFLICVCIWGWQTLLFSDATLPALSVSGEKNPGCHIICSCTLCACREAWPVAVCCTAPRRQLVTCFQVSCSVLLRLSFKRGGTESGELGKTYSPFTHRQDNYQAQ